MSLLSPAKLWSRTKVLLRPSPVPKQPGVYAWYFRRLPPEVPRSGCHVHAGYTLLYVGIAPSRPASRRSLRDRIHTHFAGNAYGSTLRLTLGCLLVDKLDIALKRRGSGFTFGTGETLLSAWMAENAAVAWALHEQPWVLEAELLATLNLPLNLQGNERHPFQARLKAIRRAGRESAGRSA